MSLDFDHDETEVFGADESGPLLVKQPKRNVGVFVVEVVQELGEFGVVDLAILLFAEVQLNEVRVQGERNILVQSCLLDNFTKFFWKNQVAKSESKVPLPLGRTQL